MAGEQAADINLAGTHAIANRIMVGRIQVPVAIEFVIEFGHAEVVAHDHRGGGVKSNGIQPVAFGGIVAVWLESPDFGDHRAEAEAAGIAGQSTRSTAAGTAK